MLLNLKLLVIARSVIIKDNKILILKRAGRENHGANQWEFPGGKLDSQEDFFSALKREIHEETNLKIELLDNMMHVDSEIFSEGKYKDYIYIELCAISRAISDDIKISHEHSDFKWIKIEEVHNYALTEEAKLVLKGTYQNILKAIDLG